MEHPVYLYFTQIDNVDKPSWQAQISGKKTWQLIPPPECEHVCQAVEATVNKGDISEWFCVENVLCGKFPNVIFSCLQAMMMLWCSKKGTFVFLYCCADIISKRCIYTFVVEHRCWTFTQRRSTLMHMVKQFKLWLINNDRNMNAPLHMKLKEWTSPLQFIKLILILAWM